MDADGKLKDQVALDALQQTRSRLLLQLLQLPHSHFLQAANRQNNH